MKKKAFLPLSSKLFLIVTALALTIVLVFVFYQYRRENEYRVELLNTKMQGYNKEMGSRLVNKDTTSFLRYERRLLRDGVRTTILDYEGNVCSTTRLPTPSRKTITWGERRFGTPFLSVKAMTSNVNLPISEENGSTRLPLSLKMDS